MALAQVGRAIQTLTGGEPRLRSGFTTDNGNQILDIHGLEIHDPKQLEQQLDGIVGVVCNGLFAARGADVLLLAGTTGVQQFQR
jgi:ribose 5-phosphate isomerase A